MKTLGKFIVILLKNILEIMEPNSFANSHQKLYVRININERTQSFDLKCYATYHHYETGGKPSPSKGLPSSNFKKKSK